MQLDLYPEQHKDKDLAICYLLALYIVCVHRLPLFELQPHPEFVNLDHIDLHKIHCQRAGLVTSWSPQRWPALKALPLI